MEDQPADPGDLTTESADKPARRRRLPWRRAKSPVLEAVPEADAEVATETSAPRVPTGKSRRTPKAAAGDAEASAPEATEATEATESEASGSEATEATESEASAPASTETQPGETPSPHTDDTATAGAEIAESEGTESAGAEAESQPEPEPVLVPYRPAGKRLLAVASAAAVLFVAAGAFAGATLQPYLSDRAAVATKLNIARTATDAITTLWTYTPDDMSALPERSSRFLAGDFANEYRKYIDAIVATNKQAQVTNTTEVLGTAVESLSPSEASAIVYTNSVSTSPVNKNIPSLRYRSYRLTMERQDADWRITAMAPITNLDLTPQL